MKPLYQIVQRVVGVTTFLSVVNTRGDVSAQSAEKALPPIVRYDERGDIQVLGPKHILKGLALHPYKANSADFSHERLADLEVSQIYAQLEHFPTLPTMEDGRPHPIAELLYSNMVYLQPDEKLEARLGRMDYVQMTEFLPTILAEVQRQLFEKFKVRIDLHAVPKHDVGKFAYLADTDGYAKVAKLLSFGLHRVIPNDRMGRELGSLKSAERFVSPAPAPFPLPEEIKPFVSMLRVAVVGTEVPMLDGVDLYPTAVPKLACILSREVVERDITKVPLENRNLEYRPNRAGVEVVHVGSRMCDETQVDPGTIRLVIPGGVKVAAQLQPDQQARDEDGGEIDALMDFRTFAAKGALAPLVMMDPSNYSKNLDRDEAERIFLSMKRSKVRIGDVEYEGYVGEIPVMRPGQRHTELSKPSNEITDDRIAKAILKKAYRVRPQVREDYTDLRELHSAIQKEIADEYDRQATA